MKTAIKIFVDADALVALTVETDTNHEKARSLLNRLTVNPVLFLTSNYVFSESITIISQRASHQTAVTFIAKMQSMESPFQITRADENIEEEAISVFRACRRITDIEIKGVTRLPIIWVKAVLKEVRSK